MDCIDRSPRYEETIPPVCREPLIAPFLSEPIPNRSLSHPQDYGIPGVMPNHIDSLHTNKTLVVELNLS